MKRSILEIPGDNLAKLIFGTGATKADIPHLSKTTKIPISTIYRDKVNPLSMTADRLIKYARARGIDTGEIKL